MKTIKTLAYLLISTLTMVSCQYLNDEWTEEQYGVRLPGQQRPIVKDRGKGFTLRDANYAKNVEHGRVLLKGLEKVIGTIVRED
ncbi:MAG: hypothetical protein LBN23_05825, partial [Paludibacter sp.]|nr:hypothetical protein [Paludibacter sp.]